MLEHYQWVKRPLCSERPVKGPTVFTDAGPKMKRAACVWQSDSQWQKHVINGEPGDSLQTLELKAVCWALGNWNDTPVNIVSDSLYVVGVVPHIEDALLKETKNQHLNKLFIQLCST
ncbi:PO113 protein, partial [Rhodinocichla rosea]|nr:PO113 protein [Rhodinocichla rosea]